MTVSRNAPCSCGSGRKYKQCCGKNNPSAGKSAFDVTGLLRQGLQLQQNGRLREAEMAYRRVLEVQPDNPDALHLLGLLAQGAGRLDVARDLIGKAVQLRPGEVMFRHNLAILLQAMGRLADAAEQAEKVLRKNPDFSESRFLLANLLKVQGGFEEAIGHYLRVLALNPQHASALNNLGATYKEAGRLNDAQACYEKLLRLQPGFAEAWNNLGAIFKVEGRYKEATAHFERALGIQPTYDDAICNLAGTLFMEGEWASAIPYYLQLLKLRPDGAQEHLDFAICLLASGDLSQGWQVYPWRLELKRPDGGSKKRPFSSPHWQGESLSGKTLLIWGEQGVGDEILFASVFPDAIRLAKRVIVECDARLVSLFARSFPEAEVVPRSDPPHPRTLTEGIDCQSPAGNLPRWYRPSLESFPVQAAFLKPDPERVARWKAWLASLGPGPKVGIAWRSMLSGEHRDPHYTALTQWGAILGNRKVHFINLQYDQCQAELEAARQQFGVQIHMAPGINLKDELDEAAALTAALDLVITAGTSVSAMAGALGKETWRYSLESDWIGHGTDHLPWLPSVRVYQKKWDAPWEPLLQQIGQELETWSGEERNT